MLNLSLVSLPQYFNYTFLSKIKILSIKESTVLFEIWCIFVELPLYMQET